MSQPEVFYLDQADWAYLHSGVARNAERELRRVGATGRAAFLITLHHFEEGTGLEDPRDRAAYLKHFPGTAFTTLSGYDLLRFEALKLARGVDPRTGLRIDLQRLADISVEQFERLVFGLTRGHRLRVSLEPAYAWRRELHRLDQDALKLYGARPTREDNLALWRAQLRGDFAKALKTWERIMRTEAEPAQREQLAAQVRLRSRGWKNGETADLLPPRGLDFDETFVHAVFPHLHDNAKRDHAAVARALAGWQRLSRSASPLSCFAAVSGAVLDNPARAYKASEQVDALHAAFASLVRVFTADKRTVTALARLELSTRVVRTNRLDEVAATLADFVGAEVC